MASSINSFGQRGGRNEVGIEFNETSFETIIDKMFDKFVKKGDEAGQAYARAVLIATDSYSKRMSELTIDGLKKLAQSAAEFSKKNVEELNQKIAKAAEGSAERQELTKQRNELLQNLIKYKEDELKALATQKRIEAFASGDIGAGRKAEAEALKQIELQRKSAERQAKIQALEFQRIEKQKLVAEAKDSEEKARYEQELKLIEKEELNEDRKEQATKKFGELVDKIGDFDLTGFFDDIVKEAASVVDLYLMKVTTRLLGSGKDWQSTTNQFTSTLALSSVVSTKEAITNLSKLVEHGIAYNVELRAFLETISDSIATTFNTFDSSLLRIIKLQQSDSTVARLGMEAALNSVLNNLYGDTSYMDSLSDSVSAAIIEATALLNKEEAVNVEYEIQKWLGAMSSVGVSDSTITSLAQAIGYMGSGNVSQLAGTPMQNLIVKALTETGGSSYSDLLTNGLNSSDISLMMSSIIEYLSKIEEDTADDLIERQAMALTFGVIASDIKASKNLLNSIESLQDYSYNYSNLQDITNNLTNTMGSRTTVTKMLTTLLNNVKFTTGLDIASDPLKYSLYQGALLSESLTGGIDIPAFSVFGTGVDMNTTVEKLIRTGIGGLTLISNIMSSVLSGNAFSNVDLNSFGATDKWLGGAINLGTTSGKSFSGVINQSGSDLALDLYDEGMEETETKKSKQTAEELAEEQGHTTEDIYNVLTDGSKTGLLSNLEKYLDDFTNTTTPQLLSNQALITSRLSSTLTNVSVADTASGILATLALLLAKFNLMSLGDDGVIDVNVTKVASKALDNEDGLPISLSKGGAKQSSVLIEEIIKSMGLTNANTNINKPTTLQDLIEFFTEQVGAGSNNEGLNVRLASVGDDVSATTFLENEKYYLDSRKTL